MNAQGDKDDYILNGLRDQLSKIKKLKESKELRDQDEAGELMMRFTQNVRRNVEHMTGVAQPKLNNRNPTTEVTRPHDAFYSSTKRRR